MGSKPPIIILCGGKGERLRGVTKHKPKPLVEVGNSPILTHIMNIFSTQGFNRFILCIGYKGNQIYQYYDDNDDVIGESEIEYVDSGVDASKSRRVADAITRTGADRVIVTYGDGIADVDVDELLETHERERKLATLTCTAAKSPYGHVITDGERITYEEKPTLSNPINIGFVVLDSGVIDYIEPSKQFEQHVFSELAHRNELAIYHHDGFFESVDTYKDYKQINGRVTSDEPIPWKRVINE